MNAINATLARFASRLGADFLRRQVEFAKSRFIPEAGFRGRAGGADFYYTRFGLRLLELCGGDLAELRFSPASFRAGIAPGCTVTDCFCILDAAQALRAAGHANFNADSLAALATQALPLLRELQARLVSEGGNLYDLFLLTQCRESLAAEASSENFALACEKLAACALAARRPDGGFSTRGAAEAGQTSATAAALGLAAALLSYDSGAGEAADRLSDCLPAAREFLLSMQREDGGFAASAAAPGADLLSTFAALYCLAGLDELPQTRPAAAARYARGLAHPGGGFSGAAGDAEADVEYAYYGLASLALLARALA